MLSRDEIPKKGLPLLRDDVWAVLVHEPFQGAYVLLVAPHDGVSVLALPARKAERKRVTNGVIAFRRWDRAA